MNKNFKIKKPSVSIVGPVGCHMPEKAMLQNDDTGEWYSTYFSLRELRCRCEACGREKPHSMRKEDVLQLTSLRMLLGRAFTPNSAFRCPLHDEEKLKDKPGMHFSGGAVDIPVRGGTERTEVVMLALALGYTGVGIYKTFVHVDRRNGPLVVF